MHWAEESTKTRWGRLNEFAQKNNIAMLTLMLCFCRYCQTIEGILIALNESTRAGANNKRKLVHFCDAMNGEWKSKNELMCEKMPKIVLVFIYLRVWSENRKNVPFTIFLKHLIAKVRKHSFSKISTHLSFASECWVLCFLRWAKHFKKNFMLPLINVNTFPVLPENNILMFHIENKHKSWPL